jgi:hypothetical protein
MTSVDGKKKRKKENKNISQKNQQRTFSPEKEHTSSSNDLKK